MTDQEQPPLELTSPPDGRTRWGQERRLAFIDFRLQFEQRLNRGDLVRFFGISTPQASQDLARYASLAPENMRYDARSKVFVRGDNFFPRFGSQDAGRYLKDLLALAIGVTTLDNSFVGWMPPIGLVPTLKRPLPASLLSRLLIAMRDRRSLQISYQSMSREGPSMRVISPHALGYDGFRWHVRAYCQRRTAFADFVLGRVSEVADSDLPWTSSEEDTAWHTLVGLDIAPNPALPPAQRSVIALDYGMLEGKVRVETRQALLYYTLRRLGLNRQGEFVGPEQHIVLVNKDEVAPYLAMEQG